MRTETENCEYSQHSAIVRSLSSLLNRLAAATAIHESALPGGKRTTPNKKKFANNQNNSSSKELNGEDDDEEGADELVSHMW